MGGTMVAGTLAVELVAPIRQDVVDAFVAYADKHGSTFYLRADFSQFDGMTNAECAAARDTMQRRLDALNSKLARLKRGKRRQRR